MKSFDNSTFYPIIEITSADPYECGIQYGQKARDLIGICINFYKESFALKAGWAAITDFAMNYAGLIRENAPDSYEMLRGISDGSRFPFEDIIAINCRYEIGKFPRLPECTTGVILPESSEASHTYVVKNWDNHEKLLEHVIIIRVKREDGFSCMAVTEAGQLLRDGFNNRRIAIVSNALLSMHDKPGLGLPANVIRNEVLFCTDSRKAAALLDNKNRIASNNTVFYSPESGAVSYEAYPGGVDYVYPEKGLLCHANHFIVNTAIDNFKYPKNRDKRLRELLSLHNGRITLDIIKDCLRDHQYLPLSICAHPDPDGPDYVKHRMTVASIIMDIEAEKMWVTKGNPCENEYGEFVLQTSEK